MDVYISHTWDIAQLARHTWGVYIVCCSAWSHPLLRAVFLTGTCSGISLSDTAGFMCLLAGHSHGNTFSINRRPARTNTANWDSVPQARKSNTNLYLYTSISQQQLSQVQNTPSPCKSCLYLSLITHHSPWLDWFGKDIKWQRGKRRLCGPSGIWTCEYINLLLNILTHHALLRFRGGHTK